MLPYRVARPPVQKHGFGTPSWIEHHFLLRSPEEDVEAIEHIAPQDAFVSGEIRLQPTGIRLPIQRRPDSKDDRRCRRRTHPAYQPWDALAGIQRQLGTIRPRQRTGIFTGDDSLLKNDICNQQRLENQRTSGNVRQWQPRNG